VFVQFGEIDETHLYKEFRGVRKTYRWSELEPEKDRYDFAGIRADLACPGRHGQRLIIQYVNMPPEATQALAGYMKLHGVGFGGPDIYPSDPVLTDPQRGV